MKLPNRVRLFATPWTAAHQDPLSMGFSRQEYWSGLPLPSLYKLLIFVIKEENNKTYFTTCICKKEKENNRNGKYLSFKIIIILTNLIQ